VLDTEEDWSTDRRSKHNFDFDFDFELLVKSMDSCSCEKLVSEAGESSGTQRKVNVRS
jgi:hypothetical protein